MAALLGTDKVTRAIRALIVKHFFEHIRGCRRVDFGRNRVVVTVERTYLGSGAHSAFGNKVVYLFDDYPTPERQRFDVVCAFFADATRAARGSLLRKVFRWPGVKDIQRLFPAAENDFTARFFLIEADSQDSALRIAEALNDADCIEHAHMQPRE